jgi:2-phospho-L-lactate guanylyltransferase
MSSTWAVVPAKDFQRAKGRLSPALSAGERSRWARETLDHVLAVLTAAGLRILVVTDAVGVQDHVQALGADAVISQAGIGDAVRQGIAGAGLRGADQVLVVMGDLPELSLADVQAVLARSEPVVVCPDLRDAGTNGLLLRILDPERATFGHVDSFRRHEAANPEAGVVRTTGWGHDVDTPGDLSPLTPPGSAARR